MKKLLSQSKVVKISMFVLVSTIIMFFGFTPDSNKELYKAHSREFDGKAIFKGIFFADHKVGQFIPELTTQQSTDQTKNSGNEIVNKIQAYDALFFDNFKISVESGNPIEVDRALFKASKLLSKFRIGKLGTALANKDEQGTATYVVVVDPTDQPVWVPGPLWNWVTAVYTGTESVSGLDKDKVILYIASQLQK